MKSLIYIICVLALSLPVMAQTYLKTDSHNNMISNSVLKTPKFGYNLCQVNQNILLDKVIEDYRFNIKQTIESLEEAKRDQASETVQAMYVKRLYNIIINQITFIKIKEQMNTIGLYNLIEASKSKNSSVIDLDNIKLDVEQSISDALIHAIPRENWHLLREVTLELVVVEVFKEVLRAALEVTTNVLLNIEIRKQIIRFLATKTANSAVSLAFKTSLSHFGKNLIINVGRGTLLNLLAYPLHGYTMSDEARLLKLAEKFLSFCLTLNGK